ncbi:hypothetical protein BY996DRAFT_8689635 [Phakopsora pachyrhizi]|nr:hypothetical protein BY996DRAFT_8689635 [Phakopsora pachyrhizi]
MSYTDEEQLQHLLNLGALVDSSVTHQEHKSIITKLYDSYRRCLETEPGEGEPQVPPATELCSVLPHMEIEDPSITTTHAEEPSITTTQAAEIEAPLDSVSKTIKHHLSHQSIQNPLPPTKMHSKRLQALPKTQAGRVLQGFQSSYSLRNPTGQGLIPQGGMPISAKDCLRFQKKTPHQKEAPQLNINHFLPRQSKSKSVSQTCSELIREGSTSSSVNVGFQSGAVTSIELMEKYSFTAEEVYQALDNCMFIIRESLKICGRKKTENEEFDMVCKALPSFIVDRCQSDIEKILQMPNSDIIMKPEWINLQALESTITMKA